MTLPALPDEEVLMTRSEFARHLGVAKSYVTKLGNQGRLDRLRIAGPPRLTDGTDMVDIDPEQELGQCRAVHRASLTSR